MGTACYTFAMAEDEKDGGEEGGDEAADAPASCFLPGPKRLAKWFAANGFDVEIKLTRNGQYSDDAPDPDADPGPVNDPIEEEELAALKGLLAAYDEQDEEPKGEHGIVGPPAKDEPPPSSERAK